MTAQQFPLSWPASWARTVSPGKSQFKTSLTAAIDNVQGSLKRFGSDSGRKVDSILVSSNVSLMERNPKDAGVAVYFTWDGISTCIAVDRYQRIEENLQAIHHVIEAERTKLRHGGLNLVRAAFRGYAALPPPSMPMKDPWIVLGVKPGASAAEIEAAFREKAKRAHPDAGGSTEQMTKLNEARLRFGGGEMRFSGRSSDEYEGLIDLLDCEHCGYEQSQVAGAERIEKIACKKCRRKSQG